MADPLSMSASIAGLISIVDLVFKAVYKHARAVKDAKSDINSLADEINGLSSVLRSLQALTLGLEADGDNFDRTLRNHYLSHCRKTIEKIEERVGKASKAFGRSKASGIIQQLKWPFATSETKELLAELSRHKETINVALSADSMRKLQLCLSRVDQLGKQTEAIVKIHTQIAVDDEKRRVLDYFMKTSPQGNLRKCISDRHPMTGLGLTESSNFRDWLETPGSRIWLSGIPGAGKTVLAGSVIQEALMRSRVVDRVGVGFFFCDYRHPITCEPSSILGALASQLARQKNEAFNILRDYYDELHPESGLPEERPDPDELRAKICSISEQFDQTIIIVDGLDECGDTSDNILQILTDLVEYGTGISMALFSRHHDNIRFQLEEANFRHISVAAQKEDIRLYVRAELEKRIQSQALQLGDMNTKEEIMEILVERAEGMFQWVVCQIDYLCDCAHDEERREALTKLPPNLPNSYCRLLERVDRFSPRVQTMVQLCLHFIAFAEPKLSILQLRQAISTPEVLGAHLDASNMISELEISRRCSSLIRKSECGEYFEFAHFSVQEFLEDEAALSAASLKCYLISKQGSRTLLAAQCLRFLQLKNFDFPSIPSTTTATPQDTIFSEDRDKKYPFYEYSAVKWLHFTKNGLDAVILDLTKSLFNPSKTKHFSLWAIRLLCHISNMNPSRAYEVVSDNSFRPLHLASALNLYEICDFLLGGDTDINFRSRAGRPIDLAIMSIHGIANPPLDLVEILPCAERRNRTIDSLIHKGARLSNNLPSCGTESIFFVAGELATTYFDGDFTPIVALLSLGVTPGEKEIQIFERKIYQVRNCSEAELSTQKLIQYLSSTSSYEKEWGFQIGSIIWQWALRRNLAYTDDHFLVDSRISLSKKALVTKLETAIQLDNTDVVKRCLNDSRLDPLTLRLDNGKTLLHVAVEYASVETIGFLLDAGYSIEDQGYKGSTPLHLCLRNHNRRVLDSFIERGISLLSLDAEGRTIWHLWAEGGGPKCFLEDLFKRVPAVTYEALLMKTPENFTPLMLSLEAGSAVEERAIKMINLSTNIPDFWQRHDPIFGVAVKRGCEKAIGCLKKVNAKLDPVSPGTCTPFHQLSARVSLKCVELLKSLFGDAYRWRFKGRLSVEIYIKKALRASAKPDPEIIEALISLDMLDDEDDKRKTPWQFVCDLQVQELENLTANRLVYYHAERTRIQNIHSVLAVYMRIGLHRAYENQCKESAIISFFSVILSFHRRALDSTFSVSTDVLHQWIVSTRFWPSARKSNAVLGYTKLAIKTLHFETVILLIDNGVDIHRAIDGTSVIEDACHTFLSSRQYDSSYKIMISKLLDKSDKENLIDLAVKKELHKLATPANASGFTWFITQLLRRGVDIIPETRRREGHIALMYHISRNSSCAELLLRIGADPTIASSTHGSLNAIQLATLMGDVSFLESVMKYTTFTIDWAQTFNCNLKIDGECISLEGINVLHMAALTGRVECLRFYLGETTRTPFITETNPTSSVEAYTPLHLAACYNRVDAIDLLLSKGATPMYKDNCGRTPLHNAVSRGHLAATKLLLEYGSTETFDIFGRKPRAYVSGPDRDSILSCLGEVSEAEEINVQEAPALNIHALSEVLELAILRDDIEECKSIFALGCPIDVRMPRCLGCSPLIMAMKTQEPMVTIIEWLLENGASVLKPACLNHGLLSPIEIAAHKPRLKSLLSRLLDAYLSQGGDLMIGDDHPVHVAVSCRNNEGLELLLLYIEKQINRIR
ncbi:hypothetical protein Hte_006160 [Hypoxylon texense]